MVKGLVIGEVNVDVDYGRQTTYEALSLVSVNPDLPFLFQEWVIQPKLQWLGQNHKHRTSSQFR